MYSQGYSDNNGSNALIKIALPAVVLFQVVTCFFIPTNYERAGEWIPLFSGFWDMDIVMTAGMKSIIYGIASAVLLLLSLYILNDKLFSSISKSFTTVAVAATLIFCDPMAVYFTSIYPAAICIVWSLYCLLTAQIFLAFFLISLASMFFAPLILTIPVVMIITLIVGSDSLRIFLKSIGGTLVPIIYVLSFRYLEFNDVGVFCSQFAEQLTAVNFEFFSKHLADLFMILCIMIVSLHAIIRTLIEQGHNNIAEANGLRLAILSAVLSAAVYFLYSGAGNIPVGILIAPMLAVILSNFFTSGYKEQSVRIEIIILLCSFIVARLGFFIS
ncbi:MAG: hypothetical protein LKM37_00155 [Bacteroidales bacterium]|jgi:hypothetical protein|nr:hypothetical protein [Bacteroidales bacterium]MCI1733361.1 hypothetical protein [Bacteroidales bacterium]